MRVRGWVRGQVRVSGGEGVGESERVSERGRVRDVPQPERQCYCV